MRNRYLERDGGATLEEAIHAFSAADLKSLARLVAKRSPPRKAELLALLRRELGGTGIRRFWGELDETGRLAVSESLHTWDGWYQGERFRAKYGRSPSWGTLSPSQRAPKPSCLWLFLPHGRMPDELRAALRSFVPPPPAHQIESLVELPETVAIPAESGGTAAPEEVSDRVPLAARQTDDAALHELRSCLRLVAAGRVAVSAKTGRVAARGAQAIRAVLHGGDFYAEAASPDAPGPMKAFAWPLILQAARLARVSGTRLALTPQGGKALDAPPETTLRAAWERWLGSTLLDEYNRVDAVKGQTRQGKRWMTAVGDRREAIVGALAEVVERMLGDLEARTHALDERGPAILVGCTDEAVADLLASDRRLRDLCLRAAPTTLVVSAAKASAFRRRVRELGYCLPPQGSPRGKRR